MHTYVLIITCPLPLASPPAPASDSPEVPAPCPPPHHQPPTTITMAGPLAPLTPCTELGGGQVAHLGVQEWQKMEVHLEADQSEDVKVADLSTLRRRKEREHDPPEVQGGGSPWPGGSAPTCQQSRAWVGAEECTECNNLLRY